MKYLLVRFEDIKNQATKKHKYVYFELPAEKEKRIS